VQKLAVFVRASEHSNRTQAPLLLLSRLNLDLSQPRNTVKLARCFVWAAVSCYRALRSEQVCIKLLWIWAELSSRWWC